MIQILQNFRGVEKLFEIMTVNVNKPIIKFGDSRFYLLLKDLLMNTI